MDQVGLKEIRRRPASTARVLLKLNLERGGRFPVCATIELRGDAALSLKLIEELQRVRKARPLVAVRQPHLLNQLPHLRRAAHLGHERQQPRLCCEIEEVRRGRHVEPAAYALRELARLAHRLDALRLCLGRSCAPLLARIARRAAAVPRVCGRTVGVSPAPRGALAVEESLAPALDPFCRCFPRRVKRRVVSEARALVLNLIPVQRTSVRAERIVVGS